MPIRISCTGHHSITPRVALHGASRCWTEGKWGVRRARGAPEHRDRTEGLQTPARTPLISSFWASCLYPALLSGSVQVKTLLLGSVQVKHNHCAEFGVGISTRFPSARCHIHSTSPAEASSSARDFPVPSKGPSARADSQTRRANALGVSRACSKQPSVFPGMWSSRYFCRDDYSNQKLFSEGRYSTSGMCKLWRSVSADCSFVIAHYLIKIYVSIKYQPSRPSQGAHQEGLKQLDIQFPWVVCKMQAAITTGH